MIKVRFVLPIVFLLSMSSAYAQSNGQCPANIGFETGTFTGWRCFSGNVMVNRDNTVPVLDYTLVESGPYPGQHTLIPRGDSQDKFGGFSLNSPNGSDYVIKLGNEGGGHGAERISYTLQVPSNLAAYSIVFNYAVVLQAPNHAPYEQPKFMVQIIDETTSTTTGCGSFEFVASGALPGFEASVRDASVVYKDWSPVLLNLTPYLGHRIRLEFTTNDCTFNQHFGYVYLDVTENCAYPVTGNVICPGLEPIVLKTVPGLNEYQWSNTITGEVLGTLDSLVLPANTPVGTPITLKLVPYPGLGCVQTILTKLDGPKVDINQPPPDCTFVNITSPSITAGSYPGLIYSYWADIGASIPLKDPQRITKTGSYYIKGEYKPGCFAVGEVKVLIVPAPLINIINPAPVDYPATVDITTSYVADPNLKYTYWKDIQAKVTLPNPKQVSRDDVFYIKVTNATGCYTIAPVEVSIIYDGIVIPTAFSPNGDGNNDVLTVLIDNAIKIRSFRVFNKWGDVVFATTDIYNYWDGTRNGTSLPVGVYYWFLDAVATDNRKFRQGGSVAILK